MGEGLARLLLALLLMIFGGAASAQVDLLRDACHAVAESGDAPGELTYRCGTEVVPAPDGWLWLRADPAAVARVRAGDTMLVDQSRFARVALVARAADGEERRWTIDGGGLRPGQWALGGHLRFVLDGQPPAELYLGFDRLDTPVTMRKWRALPADEAAALERRWLLLMGLFVGAVGASLVGSLFFFAALRSRFQLWYSLWAAATLAYGLWWSNLIFALDPSLGGVAGVRVNLILVGLGVALGARLFATYVEEHVLPGGYRRLLAASGAACAVTAMLAAADFVVPALLGDRLLNLAMVSQLLLVMIGIGLALRRSSRSVWFYALAWAPPLIVVSARVLRNFDLLPQDDAIDMATFAAMAAQAVLLSVGIADRYGLLQRERNAAAATEAMLRRLSETDALTGLANRRALIDRAAVSYAMARPVGLIVVDLDHFKRINDSHGHAIGDAVLCRVGARLLELVRRGDQVARIGGEEFAVLAETAGMVALAELAERLREGLAALPLGDLAPGLAVTASLGVAHAEDHDDARFEALFDAADAALYRAKAAGRNNVVIGAGPLAAVVPPRLRAAG